MRGELANYELWILNFELWDGEIHIYTSTLWTNSDYCPKKNKMKDKIDALCETLYTLGKNSFKDNKEIVNIIFYSLPKKNRQGKILYFCIFSLVFNQKYINEKEIESLDIIINYSYKDKSLIEVGGIFAASDGETLKALDTIGTFEQIALEIEEFIKSCYDIYPKIVKLYTIESSSCGG